MNGLNVFRKKIVVASYVMLSIALSTVCINRAATRQSSTARRHTTADTRGMTTNIPAVSIGAVQVPNQPVILPTVSSNMPFRVAMVLSGCGHMDGSEIREATYTILALEEAGATIEFFAPDKPQASVVNHASGTPVAENRNVLVESSRIARGNVSPLTNLSVAAFQALVIPGGSGATSNLCNYSAARENMQVDPTLSSIISSFRNARKPIGVMCISPVVVAKVLGANGVMVTFGQGDVQLINAITSWGARHQPCAAGDCVVDAANLVVSTPAYMYGNSSTIQVLAGIRKMVYNLRNLAGNITQEPTRHGGTEQIR